MKFESQNLINNLSISHIERLKFEFLHIVERERERERERESLLSILFVWASSASLVSRVRASFTSPAIKIYNNF